MNQTDETTENILKCARAIIELQIQKKEIDNDIKEIKQEFAEEGVPVGKVNKAISIIKSTMKQNAADILEQEIILENLEADEDIQNQIARLNT